MTMNLDKRLNDCVQTLNDEKLMAKLSGGDAIAQELKYHSTCLVGLYNRERAHRLVEKQFQEGLQQDVYPLAFFSGNNHVHCGDQIQQGRSFHLKVGGHGPTVQTATRTAWNRET